MGMSIQRVLKQLPYVTSPDLVADSVQYVNMVCELQGASSYLEAMQQWAAAVPQKLGRSTRVRSVPRDSVTRACEKERERESGFKLVHERRGGVCVCVCM